jgi:glycosyltransferase involved in cell wall biosynthesis
MPQTNERLVSTIISTHNRADLLSEALKSVISQKFDGGHEIIVVDDDSTDHTQSVVQSFDGVKYLKVKSGKPSKTRNAGIRQATGKYLAFLDDDDVWVEDRLAPAISILDNDDSIGMVYGQATMTSFDLAHPGPSFPTLPLPIGHPIAAFLNVVVHLNTVLVRRSVLDDVGLLNESVFGAEDMDITVRIARKYNVAAIERPLALIRGRDPLAVSKSSGQTAHWLGRVNDDIGLIKLHCAVKDEYQPSASEAAMILRKRSGWYVHMLLNMAASALDQGDVKEARAAAIASFKISPLHAISKPRFYKALLGLGTSSQKAVN